MSGGLIPAVPCRGLFHQETVAMRSCGLLGLIGFGVRPEFGDWPV